MNDCCRKTAEAIERAFQEGTVDYERGGGAADTKCPYSRRKLLERHWWTRGFAYQARLFRAIKAEAARQPAEHGSCLQARAALALARGDK